MGYPAVEKKQTQAFAKAWDKGGIKIILDDAAIQFATDYANIVLKSFVDDLAAQARKKMQAQQAKGVFNPNESLQVNSAVPVQANSVAPTQAKPASKIILTD